MRIEKAYTFEASHILPRHPGKCSRLHGHSYAVCVAVFGPVLLETGFVMDYAVLDSIVAPVIDALDHRHLNSLINYPSAENIAAHIAYILRSKLLSVDACEVLVRETAKTSALWSSQSADDVARLGEPDPKYPHIDYNGWRSPQIRIPVSATIREAYSVQQRALACEALRHFQEADLAVEQIRLWDDSLSATNVLGESK